MSPVLHPEEINFCRFMFLILRRTPITVRTYFDSRHPPLQLMTDLAVNKDTLSALKGRIISAQQWKTLFPSSGYVNSRQFDVTLLILLLRYMTNVPAPATGFDKLPPQTDDSVGADLARIKHYRNIVAHSNNAKLSETDLNDYWADIESAIERLGGKAQLLETKTLKTSLIEEKDREIMVEIRQLGAQLQETIPQNIKEQIQDLLDFWTEEDAKFHETRASTEVYNLTQSQKCVSVVGNSGAGKSAIVHHVALNMQNKGYCVVPIKVPNEILQYFNENVDQIFVIDDPCGERSIDFYSAKEWKRYEDDIMRCLSKTANTRLLLCDRGKHLNNSCPLDGLNFITIPCITGKKDILEFLLNEGICTQNDVNTFVHFTYQSVTPLTAACKFGHIDIVNLLIENAASVNFPDKNGNTPLVESCCNGHGQIVKVLIEKGVNLEERCCLDLFDYDYILDTYDDEYGKEGWSALWWACKGGHSSIVSYLIDKGANIHNTNKAGKTPLWAAIQSRKFDVVALLVEKGIKINEQDTYGRTPIWWASNVGKEEILNIFIDHDGMVNICDHNDISPLYTACYRSHIDCVKLLINHGANVNTEHLVQPSPLTGACCGKNIDLISLLIRSGADVNYAFQGLCSPLSIATWSSFQDCMTILIKSGAEVNTTFDNRKTVLTQCIFDHPKEGERLRFLLHDLHTADDDWFLFHPGVLNSNLHDIISVLINFGCDLNVQDEHGLTALMGVVQRNRECTKLLLEHGACVNATDEDSRSALHYACLAEHHEEVVLLIEHGADINARDESGFTPLYYACKRLDVQTLDILLNNGADVNVRLNQLMTALFYLLYNAIFEKRKLIEYFFDEDLPLNVLLQ
ncbi:ankyrin repeat domain-containing protein 17-like [Saccostrea echinata]|uniref:ankyrin repeat domain-containing protein 17-like n=1 Tax=Saccostrea echinata TaxID=191078 RepID=UPI002A81B97F|nr:ankyrin repeat domain-containing protein 17-like [Saccostrea echinata]